MERKRDLSLVLASPNTSLTVVKKQKSNLDHISKILNNLDTYNTKKYDIEQIEKEAKLDAKKSFFDEIEGLNLRQLNKNFNQTDQLGNFNKICLQLNNGDENKTVFNCEQFLIFTKDDFYQDDKLNEKLIEKILLKNNKIIMFKTAIKLISIETNLENIYLIKKFLIDQSFTVSIEDIYTTLIKILINSGINLKLLERYVIKYENIKNTDLLKRKLLNDIDNKQNTDNNDDLDLIQSFVHIVDLIEMFSNSTKILDQQILADYVSIILILFCDKQWRFNTQSINSLTRLFILVLKRIDNSQNSIKLIIKIILRFFKKKNDDFFEFLDFFPANNANLINIKSNLCKLALKKYNITIGHAEEKIDTTFTELNSKLTGNEMRLIISLIDNFYRTKELDDKISQYICNKFEEFKKSYEFELENQNSIELLTYLNFLIKSYDKTPKESPKKKKIKGEHAASSRPGKTNDSKTIQKIWDDMESEFNDSILDAY